MKRSAQDRPSHSDPPTQHPPKRGLLLLTENTLTVKHFISAVTSGRDQKCHITETTTLLPGFMGGSLADEGVVGTVLGITGSYKPAGAPWFRLVKIPRTTGGCDAEGGCPVPFEGRKGSDTVAGGSTG